MAPKSANPGTFTVDEVAAIIAFSHSTSIPSKVYAAMSALDGTRTVSSFDHSFRPVLARAREIRADIDAGKAFAPVETSTPRKKRAAAPDSGGASDAAVAGSPAPKKPRTNRTAKKGTAVVRKEGAAGAAKRKKESEGLEEGGAVKEKEEASD